MKYFIIAGEASGDLHASHLMRELKIGDRNASFSFFGGDLMAHEGGTLLKHYREMAFMGLFPVIFNLHKIKRNFTLAEQKLLEFNPDVLILVNYPVRFVGNPTIDELAHRPNQQETFADFILKNKLQDKPVIALLAGSRHHEIKRILPVLATVSKRFADYQFVIAGAPSQSQLLYDEVLGKTKIPVVFGQTYELLQQSTAALVASGTATLETAYINIPQVVCYRIEAGRLGTWVKDQLIKIPFISLVNLIAGREIVKELFQQYCTPDTVSEELNKILTDKTYREAMLSGYAEVMEDLGGPGCAERAASLMIELLNKK